MTLDNATNIQEIRTAAVMGAPPRTASAGDFSAVRPGSRREHHAAF